MTEGNVVVDLCLWVKKRDHKRVQECLEADPMLAQQSRWSGVSPLHRAVANSDVEMAKLLIAYGANVNVQTTWGWYTPLHLACKLGDDEMMQLLVAHGADWHRKDKHQKTPLQWAVRAGKASIAYRMDQQLHAKAREAHLQTLEASMATSVASTSFSAMC